MITNLTSLLSDSPAAALPILFVGGVVTSLTPCIYPMIPITAAIIGGNSTGARQSGARTFALTMSYVLGLALVYATLGLVAGMTGSLFGGVSASPWTSLLLGNLMIASALMMLDVISVPVPRGLMSRAASMSGGGRLLATFAMGAASGLVVAPCGAPVMGAVLTWVAGSQRGTLGFVYLFVFSLGMSVFLIAVGISAGTVSRLPRSGRWMLWVKRLFAVVMLGAAEYYFINTGKLL